MTFVETNFVTPTRHNPYLHKIVVDELKGCPRGLVLDLPSGPGFLLQDLQALGFQGIAAEIDEKLRCLKDIQYESVDMAKPFPFKDGTFEYVVSVEGIEHIENHFSFLREIARVLKPGGKLFLTTPNVHSLESRWNFLWSGFHQLAEKPIPLNSPNIYFEHINPIDFNELYFACETAGLKIEKLKTHRFRKGSSFIYFLFYPLIWMATYRACFVKEKDSDRKLLNRPLFKFLMSRENSTGTHTIITARRI